MVTIGDRLRAVIESSDVTTDRGAAVEGVEPLGGFAAAASQVIADLRRRVGMDRWWVLRRRGDEQVVLASLDSTGAMVVGATKPWTSTYCALMLAGEGPQASGDVAGVPRYAAIAAREAGSTSSMLTVPLPGSGGRVLGTLCAVSSRVRDDLTDHLTAVRLQAGLLGALLEHELTTADQVRRTELAELAAHTDPLTHVANRRGWEAALRAEEDRAARYALEASVVVVDLDGLKRINDAHGHQAGDALLRRTAAVLAGQAGPLDVLARLGGDEFALILPGTASADALLLADRLTASLRAAGVEASVGVGEQHGRAGLSSAWQQADAAMYVAKREKGRTGADVVDLRVEVPVEVPVPVPVAAAAAAAAKGAPPAVVSHVDALLDLVRHQLGMDVAFVSRFDGDHRFLRHLVAAVPVPLDLSLPEPLRGTHCDLLVRGLIDGVQPDLLANPLTATLRTTVDLRLGSYVGVPLHRRDGRLYGTLCAVSREPDPTLRQRDADVLQGITGALMDLLQTEEHDTRVRSATVDRLDALAAAGGPSMVYQPVVELGSGAQVGVEALARFPQGTPGPARWFADAASVGTGSELELGCVRAALGALESFPGRFVSLNVSASTVIGPALARALEGADLRRVVLEITEHEEVDDYAGLRGALRPLREAGVRVAVDDAGAGFASLRHVLALAPDLVKLDLALVAGIDADRARQALAAAMVTFTGSIGAAVIAEGVETDAELDCLRGLGVPLGQGYHLGMPSSAPELLGPVAASSAPA